MASTQMSFRSRQTVTMAQLYGGVLLTTEKEPPWTHVTAGWGLGDSATWETALHVPHGTVPLT